MKCRYIMLIVILTITSSFAVTTGAPASQLKLILVKNSADVIQTQQQRTFIADSWILGNIWNVLAASAAIVFIFGGVAIAFYYFYYINYYGYSKDGYATSVSKLTKSIGDKSRLLDSENTNLTSRLNWTQVLYLISLAESLYENSDFDGLECLKKSMCEYSQSKKDTSLEKGLLFLFLDAMGALPLPDTIKYYLKEYRVPLEYGRNVNNEGNCANIYSKCTPAFMNFINEYQKLIRN